MTGASPLIVSRWMAAATVLVVLAIGAGGTYFFMRDRIAHPGQDRSTDGATAAAPASPPRVGSEPAPSTSSGPLPDVIVALTQEAVDRAGIGVTAVSTQTMADQLALPGIVEPNAYRQVSVTPLVGGRVVKVSAELGSRVRRGQIVAEIYAPEVAEARTKYIAARAMLDAHDRELQRTQKLVEIGAASRQELDRIHAEHAAQTAEVESARSRLQLFGADGDPAGTGQDASATTSVPAPIDGVVTERLANVGLNVDPATRLFTIVDLSNVWVIANAYERDLPRIREGARVTVTAKAFPERPLEGRVSYIDPQLSESSRTAKVRVEVDNPRGDLRLGMYADVQVAAAGTSSVPSVPKSAIQNVGSHQVVYLAAANDPPTFTEREVRVGRSVGDAVEVLSGLGGGESVVSKGSFHVRAEVERLGLRASARAGSERQPARAPTPAAQSAKVVVSESGFEPAKVRLRAGSPARITFVRTTDKTCGTEVVFPSLDIKRSLPLNEPVTIEFTPTKTGEIAFACGMNMLRGAAIVE